MEQDTNMNTGATEASSANPYATLQTSITPQTFEAMEVIFKNFNQCFAFLENATLSTQAIQDAIQAGFANANFNVTVQSPTNIQHTTQSSCSVSSAPCIKGYTETLSAHMGLEREGGSWSRYQIVAGRRLLSAY